MELFQININVLWMCYAAENPEKDGPKSRGLNKTDINTAHISRT
jgi:hypothetical protein